MVESTHQQYRAQLRALSEDEWLLAHMNGAARREGWYDPERSWKRSYGWFEPSGEPFAVIVFETEEDPQVVCMVEAFTDRTAGSSRSGAAGAGDWPGAGFSEEGDCWLRIRRFPSDERLPTLPDLLAQPGTWRVERYRPHRQCTLRLRLDQRNQFVKVYPDDRGGRVHENCQALWSAAERGRLEFTVARPVRWCRELRALWQEEIAGKPLKRTLMSDLGPPLAERMGRAAASIVRSGLAPSETFDGAAQLRRASRYGRQLSSRIPALATPIRWLLKRLSELHRAAERATSRPIHGALHIGQWLDDGTRLGLVDFDRFSLGDPEADAATFLTEMEFKSPATARVKQINDAFLSGYQTVAGPLNQDLLLAYRGQRGLAKALKTSRALRPDGDLQAEVHLRVASRLAGGS